MQETGMIVLNSDALLSPLAGRSTSPSKLVSEVPREGSVSSTTVASQTIQPSSSYSEASPSRGVSELDDADNSDELTLKSIRALLMPPSADGILDWGIPPESETDYDSELEVCNIYRLFASSLLLRFYALL